MPGYTLARSIEDNNGGRPFSRLSLAEALNKSPDSSGFRDLITSSSSYGLTSGGYAAQQIALTELGKSIVAPRNDEETRQNLLQAALSIDLFKKLCEHFDQHKIPATVNFKNILTRDYAVSVEQAEACINQFLANGKFVGLIRSISGVDRVSIHDAGITSAALDNQLAPPILDEPSNVQGDASPTFESTDGVVSRISNSTNNHVKGGNRVFITHGKNRSIAEQLKQILTYGKFEPIIAVEHESVAKPVPQKVLDEMKSCFAGIIHVAVEETLLDSSGKTHSKINDNVLIEIGAALAFYDTNVVLLVQKGIDLPSNLQGLYRCVYEGDQLGFEATMKLLKTFNEFKTT